MRKTLATSPLIVWALGALVFALPLFTAQASPHFVWSTYTGGSASIETNGTLNLTGISDIVFFATTTDKSLRDATIFAGGGITSGYPYDTLNNVLFTNFGPGSFHGGICFGESGAFGNPGFNCNNATTSLNTVFFSITVTGTNTPSTPNVTLVFNSLSSTTLTYNSNPLTQTNTRFVSYTVQAGGYHGDRQTTNIEATYYLDPNEQNSTVNERNVTQIKFSYAWATNTIAQYVKLTSTPTGTTDTLTFDNPVNPDVNTNITYADVLISFANGNTIFGAPRPFPDSYLYLQLKYENDAFVSVEKEEFYGGLQKVTPEVQYEECGLGSLSGCFNNSMRFLFVPSQNSLADVSAVTDDLFTRIPFVYVKEIKTVASEIFNTPQAHAIDLTFDLPFGSIPVLSTSILENAPYVDLIRSLLSASLYILFALSAYRIAKGAFSQHEHT